MLLEGAPSAGARLLLFLLLFLALGSVNSGLVNDSDVGIEFELSLLVVGAFVVILGLELGVLGLLLKLVRLLVA